MRNSYVGIIVDGRLESLQLETEHAAHFLARRLRRFARTPAICYWAVLDHADAETIHWNLQQGKCAEALQILESTAQSLGTIVPIEIDNDFAFVG